MTLYVVYGFCLNGMGTRMILVGVYDSERVAHQEAQAYWLKVQTRLQLVIEPMQLNDTASIEKLYRNKYSTYYTSM